MEICRHGHMSSKLGKSTAVGIQIVMTAPEIRRKTVNSKVDSSETPESSSFKTFFPRCAYTRGIESNLDSTYIIPSSPEFRELKTVYLSIGIKRFPSL
jgi:hypothetical protein